MNENPDRAQRSDQDALEWDQRYSESEQPMWSGAPNGTLVTELDDQTPARVLDVGCGEGADAIWLSEKGWTVTAVDISKVAIERAQQLAEAKGTPVDFQHRDVNTQPFPPDVFELVVLCFPALRQPEGQAAVKSLAASITTGGQLLVVGHDLDLDHGHDHHEENSFNPADYVSIDDMKEILGSEFEVTVDEVRDRPNPPEGARHLSDRIFRLRRTGINHSRT